MRYLSFLLLLPYITDLTPADTSYTEYSFGVGAGQYATTDCAGRRIPSQFVDGGLSFTHKFEGPLRVGLAASVVSAKNGSTGVVPYPDLALDFRYFSVGTTGVRVGSYENFYGDFGVADHIPAFSGKGFFRLGVGWKAADWNTRFWLGVNSLPYQKAGLAGQVDFPLSENNFLFLNSRIGESGGVSEYGLSLGLRMRTP